MKLTISTPSGSLFDGDVTYVVCKNQDGEFAIFKDHVPTVSLIQKGYIKAVASGEEFVVMSNGVLEFSNNVVTVLAQEAYAGKSLTEARKKLEEYHAIREAENKKKLLDYTMAENELKKQIKKTGAGKI